MSIQKFNKYIEPRLGIDFGGVIMPMMVGKEKVDDQFNNDYVNSPPQENALNKIRSLTQMFKGNVWIVSKAGEYIEGLTKQWMADNFFFMYTGIIEDHVLFCREREEKGIICVNLGITHFIDDRFHIMQILKGKVPCLFLFGNKERNYHARKWTILVENWNETHDKVLESINFKS